MPPANLAPESEETHASVPILPLSLALAVAPGGLVDAALDAMLAAALSRHRRLFARLAPLGPADILIDPTDLPVVFRLRIDGARGALRSLPRGRIADPAPRTTVRGTFAALVELLEGRVDGDALFFARRLGVEGDTAPVVALRNALEADPVRIDALALAPLWPFDQIARPLAQHAMAAIREADRCLAALRRTIERPLAARLDEQEQALRGLAARLARLEDLEERRP
jgi:predicted lipid carrier protein YhbT